MVKIIVAKTRVGRAKIRKAKTKRATIRVSKKSKSSNLDDLLNLKKLKISTKDLDGLMTALLALPANKARELNAAHLFNAYGGEFYLYGDILAKVKSLDLALKVPELKKWYALIKKIKAAYLKYHDAKAKMEARKLSDFKGLFGKVKVPAGFEKSFETNSEYGNVFQVKSPTIRILFSSEHTGHTFYRKVEGGTEYTFDRRGVSDSFYWGVDDAKTTVSDIEKELQEQLKRVAEALDYHKTAISIPSIPFTVSPQALENIRKVLSSPTGKYHFVPSGFGTGYVISRIAYKTSTRAPKEMETLFSVAPLYISKTEHD